MAMDWEAQWKQLKTELDALNPKYDAATARIRELEATLALCQKEKAEAEATRDAAAAHCIEQGGKIIALEKNQADALATASGLRDEVVKYKAANVKLLAGLNAANAAQAAAAKAITEALHASI